MDEPPQFAAHSFEIEVLTQEENFTGLAAINRDLIARVEALELFAVFNDVFVDRNILFREPVPPLVNLRSRVAVEAEMDIAHALSLFIEH